MIAAGLGRPGLRLFPLTVAVILFVTAVPIEWRAPIRPDFIFDVSDFALNVLLFVPLGIAARRHGTGLVFAASALLSIGIEITQVWSINRYPGLPDVAANVLGAVSGLWLGRVAAQRWPRLPLDEIPVTRWLAGAAAAGAAALVLAWALPVRPTNLSAWDTGYELVLGNEVTGFRAWRGVITAGGIMARPLTREAADALARADDRAVSTQVAAQGGWVLPAPVVTRGGRAERIADAGAAAVLRRAIDDGTFTLVARVVPATANQGGPARIVTFSRDALNQNFVLGQDGRRVVFRVRTPITGAAGLNPHALSAPVLEAGVPSTIVATFDGMVSRIYVDGRLAGRRNLAAAGCAVPGLCDVVLPFGTAALGALLMVVAVAVAGPATRPAALLAAVVAAAAASALLQVTGAGLTAPLVAPWLPWSATGGVGAVLASLKPAVAG